MICILIFAKLFIRVLRGPTKYYPQPYDDIVPDENKPSSKIRKCIEVNDTQVFF